MTDGDETGDSGDERHDPFEQLEADVEGRQGDPFEQLDESVDAAESGDDSQPEQGRPFGTAGDIDEQVSQQPHSSDDSTGSHEDLLGESDGTTSPSRTPSGVGRETAPGDVDPFAGIEREGDPFEDIGGAFEEMDVGGVDPERVWQDLASAESRGSVGDTPERTYAEVSKHAYCERCAFFSDPPDVECHHEGTEIVEFLNMETVRVVDCPVVAEREALENE